MEDQKLKEYFKFDETDLSTNRSGSLTEKQKVRLTAELKSERTKKTLLAYFLFFLAAIGVIGAVVIWFIPESSLGMRIGFGIGFGLVWPAVYIFMGLIFLPPPSYTDLELASATGQINIVKVESRNTSAHTTSSRYDLYIGNRRFVVDHRIGNILVQGDEYVVYYLKNSSRIVSAEFISQGK